MKISNYFIYTYKYINNDIKFISNKFLIKSGFINQIYNGIYIYLPICYKLIKKIIFLIKKEIKKINFIEFLLPLIQPVKLIKLSNRILNFKSELFFLNNKFILSPTNEEIIIYFLKNKINYINLPLNLYQINNKFRNEIRSNSGLIRCKEFLMKDGYSLNLNLFDFKKNYENIYNIYISIFNKIGLNYNILLSKDLLMGGYFSHEFFINLDFIYYNNLFKFSNFFNLNKKIILYFKKYDFIFYKIFILNISDFYLFSDYLKFNINIFFKISIFLNNNINNKINFFFLYHRVNFDFKLKKTYRLINFIEINKFFNLNYNYLGLNKKFKIKIFIDKLIYNLNNFLISSNKKNYIISIFKKIKNKNIFFKKINFKKKIEIAHIFQLGNFYSKKFNFKIKNKNNNYCYLLMSSFGIGITRIISAFIEQNYDNFGIIWNKKICPIKIILCSLGYNYINIIKIFTDKLYYYFLLNNIETIIDDRVHNLGFILNDWNLMGSNYKIIITEKNLKKKKIEYIYRKYLFSNFLNIKFINYFIKKINYKI